MVTYKVISKILHYPKLFKKKRCRRAVWYWFCCRDWEIVRNYFGIVIRPYVPHRINRNTCPIFSFDCYCYLYDNFWRHNVKDGQLLESGRNPVQLSFKVANNAITFVNCSGYIITGSPRLISIRYGVIYIAYINKTKFGILPLWSLANFIYLLYMLF